MKSSFYSGSTKLKNQLIKSWLSSCRLLWGVYRWIKSNNRSNVVEVSSLIGAKREVKRIWLVRIIFWFSEYARKTAVLGYVAFFDTKDHIWVVLNELLQGIAQANQKKKCLSFFKRKVDFSVSYRFEEFENRIYGFLRAAELLEIKWTGTPWFRGLSFADNIRTEFRKD